MNIHYIGIDIGGTKMRGVRWNGTRAVRSIEFSTPKSKKQFIKRIEDLVLELDGKCKGIGIGTAGVIKHTTLIFSPNIPTVRNLDFKKHVTIIKRFLPLIRVDNDARCFARAQIALNPSLSRKNRVFALTIGTGIGRAFAKNGKVIKIKRFEYPQKWEKEYQKIRNNDSLLTEFLGKKLATLITPFNPSAIVIGGGVTIRKNFIAKLKKEFKKHDVNANVLHARLNKNSAAIGAALLLKNE